jgi:CRP/FNR family transcriptional regulator, cyclic AMP receptor protein
MNSFTYMTLIDFFHNTKPTVFKKHEIFIRPDDSNQNIFFLDSGYVRMYIDTPDGKELTFNIFKPRAYFPVSNAFIHSTNTYYYQTLTPSVLYKIPSQELLSFLKQNPEELLNLTKRIVSGLDGYLIHSKHLLFGNARKRIASTMILCALRFGENHTNNTYKITIMLTHQDIGNLTALTRETTSIEIEKLLQEEIISYERRKLVIHDLQKLYDIVGEDSISYSGPNI